MVTGRTALNRLASISFVALFGLLAAGCGDDLPSEADGGTGGRGTGGSGGGSGGDAGVDSRDADAGEAGDVSTDRGETAETGDVPTDRGETAETGETGETGDVPVDRSEAGETGDVPTETTPEVARDCFMVVFDQPVNNSTLTAANDKDNDQCVNGFQYDVKITSADAPDGTAVTLFGNNVQLTTATVTAGKATFTGVQLASAGDTTLAIQFPGTRACTLPSTQSKVTVTCTVPACAISKPIKTTLNGIPTTQGGDRVSADGSPYQTAFEVTTNINDGRPVALKINNAATPGTVATVMGTAMSGKATFAGVTLSPDATYEAVATCTDQNNVVGSSAKSTFKVDTTSPDLTISSPASGAFFGPTDLTNGAFRVCGKTTAADAVALPPSVGVLANNFCITGTTNCTPVAAVGTDACVNFTCPGGAPFDISVNLNDGAGNTVTKTVTGVACASALPSVRIVAPVSDAPTFNDATKHILSATGTSPLKDLDGATAGAQANVTACADRAGTAQLLVGHAGDASLATLGSAIATTAAGVGECPSGFGFVAHFNGVTLPESTESATGALTAATELQVRLTDVSTATGSSTPLDIWIDTSAPVVALMSPAGLCGSFQQTGTTFTSDVSLTSNTGSVTLTVTNGSSTDTRTTPTFASGVATFTAVAFDQGQNALAAVATDPAGNSTTLAPVPCTVTVGGSPTVTFSTPLMTQKLCPNGSVVAGCIADNDPGTPGWQGSITAHVTVGGIPLGSTNVAFTIGATTLGAATLDVNGDATLAITTNLVPEGAAVTFTATTDPVPAHGVGIGTVTVNVDTLPPGAAGVPTVDLMAMTDAQRRQTTFPLTWIAPSDNGRTVVSYQVRVAKVPITISNFDDTAANVANPNFIVTQDVPYTGMPSAGGFPDGTLVPNLNIELGYYFAVAPIDSSGTRGPISATTTAVAANFKTIVLTDPGAGFAVDSGDFGTAAGMAFAPDSLADLVVGSRGSNAVRIYFATGTGYSAASSTLITFPAPAVGTQILFLANIGDFDGDTRDDLAVSSNTASTIWIFSRKSPSFGSSWPSMLTQAAASYTITVDPASLFNAKLSQRPLTRLGNYDAMGPDDLAVGFSGYVGPLGQRGSVLIIKGSSSFPATLTVPEPIATNTIQIDGSATNLFFGATAVGIGQFYPTPAGSTLLIGDTGKGTAAAFAGPLSIASQTVVDSVNTDYSRTFGVMGPLGGAPNAVTVASTLAGRVDIHLGSVATGGPFNTTAGMAPSARTTLVDSAAQLSFGVVNLGGGIRGTTGSVSFIGGDMTADLVVGGLSEGVVNAGPLYIVNGVAIPNLPAGNVDVFAIGPTAIGTGVVPTIVKINVTPGAPAAGLPAGGATWNGYSATTVVRDLNGDGAGDFAFGEIATAPTAGRVVVFW